MNKKHIFLFFAIFGIFLWNTPQTSSIFYGQHTFYNVSQVSCEKCHEKISINLTDAPTQHQELGCKGCHKPDGNTSHAAKIVVCNDCHIKDNSSLSIPTEHILLFPNCQECHQHNGQQILGIIHGNNHGCITCHKIRFIG